MDVGGRKLHLYCTGKGSPAVILEAGAGACLLVLAPPVPEHAQKISEAIAQQNVLSFKGSKRQDGTFTRFELKQTGFNKAQLSLLDTPVADHPWQLVRVQKPE